MQEVDKDKVEVDLSGISVEQLIGTITTISLSVGVPPIAMQQLLSKLVSPNPIHSS